MTRSGQATQRGRLAKLWPVARFLLVFAALAWLLRSLVVAPFSIPSGSMLPTMWAGDYLFTAKWPYGYSSASFPREIPKIEGRVMGDVPERGDIVIFKHPTDGTDWVKRVIALPGDRVATRGGRLFLNGRAVKREPAASIDLPMSRNMPCKAVVNSRMIVVDVDGGAICRYPAFRETLPNGKSYMIIDQAEKSPGDDFGPVTVPEGHLFLMGDNRDDSLDSRFTVEGGGIAFVPVDRVVGRAAIAFWSTDGSADYALPWTWFTALRPDRIGMSYQP